MKWRSRASSSLFPPNWPCKCQTGCEKAVWTPPSISVSHLLFLFITAHSFAPATFVRIRLRALASTQPYPELFPCYITTSSAFFSVTHLPSTTFFLIWWKTEKILRNKMILTRVMCTVMDGRTWFFFSTELFVCFVIFFFFFGPLRTQPFLLAEMKEDVTHHLPDLAL